MDDTKFVHGVQKLGQRFRRIRDNINLPNLTQDVATLLEQRTIRRFDREVDPDEKPWPELSKSGESSKRRAGFGNKKLMQRTGTLRGSIKRIRGGFGTTFTNTGATMRIGIQDKEVAKYARVHNRGLGGFPMRRFLGIGALDIRAIDSLMRRKAKKLIEVQ